MTVVRGWKDCPYHQDIYEKFKKEEINGNYKEFKVKRNCPGGGRIQVDTKTKQILIYGYSQSYGQADHSMTREIILHAMPDYEVSWHNEGY